MNQSNFFLVMLFLISSVGFGLVLFALITSIFELQKKIIRNWMIKKHKEVNFNELLDEDINFIEHAEFDNKAQEINTIIIPIELGLCLVALCIYKLGVM